MDKNGKARHQESSVGCAGRDGPGLLVSHLSKSLRRAIWSEHKVKRDIREGLNKKILEELEESYSTTRISDAVDQLDKIRGLVETRIDEGCELRERLFQLWNGMSYLLNGNFGMNPPDENLADLAHDIEDQMFEIIEAAEAIRAAIEPILLLSIEDGEETEEDLEEVHRSRSGELDW